jgi:uracil-DNA glycosylase family 4
MGRRASGAGGRVPGARATKDDGRFVRYPAPGTLHPAPCTLSELAAAVRACTACPLSRTRKNAVPGEGSGRRGIVLVGEAPGAKEDQQGRPFVGQAGKLLGVLLKKNGILREEVFITNVVKCRPPKNRPPKPSEVKACRPYIERQLQLLAPRMVCPMGNSALRALADPKANITKVHGSPVEIKGLRIFPLYHPAAVLYRRRLMDEMEKDFERLAGLARRGIRGESSAGRIDGAEEE